MKYFVLLSAILGFASTSHAGIVLDDDCNFSNGTVSVVNPGVWNERNSNGFPNYNALGKMRITSGNAVRSVGEWNPEGDDVYYSAGPDYPLGDPKAVTFSFDFEIDAGLSTASRLLVITRTSDQGEPQPLLSRGLRAEIRPNRDGNGLFIDTDSSGLANNGDTTGSLQTDGTTTGAAMVTGGFTGDMSDSANRYRMTIIDTIDLYTLLLEGTAGSINGESVEYSIDLSGRTHKNSDTNPGHNHVWIGANGGAFHVDNIRVTVDTPAVVASTNVFVADTLAVEFDSEQDVIYELESTPDLLDTNNWSGTGSYVIGNGTNKFLFDPDTFSTSKNYRVHERLEVVP